MPLDAIAVGNNPPDDINFVVAVGIGGEPIKHEMNSKRCFGTLGQSVRVWWRPVPGHQFVDAILRPAVYEARE